ncbi:MAG: septum formation initiator family protein [bacterium]
MSYWALIRRFTWIVTAVLLVIGLVALFMPKCRNFQDLQARRLTLTEDNDKLRGQIRELEQNQQRFKTDAEFVERLAREQGRVKPGETLYKITGTNR